MVQQQVCQTRVQGENDQMQRLIDAWTRMVTQRYWDATDQRRRRLHVCLRATGRHSEY